MKIESDQWNPVTGWVEISWSSTTLHNETQGLLHPPLHFTQEHSSKTGLINSKHNNVVSLSTPSLQHTKKKLHRMRRRQRVRLSPFNHLHLKPVHNSRGSGDEGTRGRGDKGRPLFTKWKHLACLALIAAIVYTWERSQLQEKDTEEDCLPLGTNKDLFVYVKYQIPFSLPYNSVESALMSPDVAVTSFSFLPLGFLLHLTFRSLSSFILIFRYLHILVRGSWGGTFLQFLQWDPTNFDKTDDKSRIWHREGAFKKERKPLWPFVMCWALKVHCSSLCSGAATGRLQWDLHWTWFISWSVSASVERDIATSEQLSWWSHVPVQTVYSHVPVQTVYVTRVFPLKAIFASGYVSVFLFILCRCFVLVFFISNLSSSGWNKQKQASENITWAPECKR